MKNKSVLTITVMFASIALLAGCTSSSTPDRTISPTPVKTSSATVTPTPTASAPGISTAPTDVPSTAPTSPAVTPKPTATAKPVVKTTVLNIGADAFTVKNPDGSTFGIYPYNASPSAAIVGLTKIYGHAPKIVYTGPPQQCSGGENIYTWDNFTLEFYSVTKDPAQVNQYSVHTNGANTTYKYIVQAPNGTQVGNSFKKLIAANPSLPKQETDYKGTHYTEVLVDHTKYQKTYDTSSAGTVASGDNDVVRLISAPADLYQDC